MKIIIILTAALLLMTAAAYHNHKSAAQYRLLAENYRRNTDILSQKIRRIYDEKELLETRNAALESAVKEDSPYFDWKADISRTAVIMRLRRKGMRLP